MTMIRKLWAGSAPLTAVGVLFAVAAVAFAGLLGFDQRDILGQPAWLKPLKFAISLAIYSLSVAWLLRLPTRLGRLARAAGAVVAVLLTLELVIIAVQAARGVPSHFNATTPLDNTLFTVMGIGIGLAWFASLVIGGVLLAQRGLDRLTATTITTGLGLTLLGAALGFLMAIPTGGGEAVLANGDPVTLAGAHSVGVADGGPGLPLLGWSTEGGDLRVPHFVGLHGLQVMPLLAVAALRQRRWSEDQRIRLVRVGALAYAALTLILTWQALRGQPLLRPDATTLTALTVLAAAVLTAVVLVDRGTPRPALALAASR